MPLEEGDEAVRALVILEETNGNIMTSTTTTTSNDTAWRKALTRSMASAATWFVTEYPKLIFQQQQQTQQQHDHHHRTTKSIFGSTLQIYSETPWKNHVRGALSSAAQRGSSAYIMFYGQATISNLIMPKNKNNNDQQQQQSTWYYAGIAGLIGGGLSALVHTLFEPIKIRQEPLTWPVYRASLWPMAWRHALFDGTFFASCALLQQQGKDYHFSYAMQFGISALAASTVNLTHDVWKTQFIQALPCVSSPLEQQNQRQREQQQQRPIKWITVVRSLTVTSFRQQLLVKAIDLGFNWWATGLLYAYLFQL